MRVYICVCILVCVCTCVCVYACTCVLVLSRLMEPEWLPVLQGGDSCMRVCVCVCVYACTCMLVLFEAPVWLGLFAPHRASVCMRVCVYVYASVGPVRTSRLQGGDPGVDSCRWCAQALRVPQGAHALMVVWVCVVGVRGYCGCAPWFLVFVSSVFVFEP